ncbi:LysR substrate-binding domain-containing protein [Oceaniovalibus sp. ACAM 378]|uniref:LysR substrate-binding domain-containing protein n=1 Tax=Oceaniovalibus sp. ACAM 378 TaxID=2599923 RepID=UPI00165209A9|nr:LysR substrate-binding domain-containing protein [Oceaniovalibus sp. ACAM 378]
MTDWMPSLNALRAFEATARHLSFVRAADELRVTPSAVKQLVRKLESALNTPLIERHGSGLRLTTAGHAGLHDIGQGFDQIARGVSQIRTHDDRKRLIISVEPSFATAWLVPRLDRFRSAFPEVDVLIDSSLALVDLHRGAADVAIRFGSEPEDGLVAQRLFDEALCAFCAPSLTQGEGAIRSLEDLDRVPLIHWDLAGLDWAKATRAWMGWELWLSRLGVGHIDSSRGIKFRDYNLAVQAAIAGQGVVLGSLPVMQDFVASGLLVRPFREKVETDIGYDLTATTAAIERPEVRDFIVWVTGETNQTKSVIF